MCITASGRVCVRSVIRRRWSIGCGKIGIPFIAKPATRRELIYQTIGLGYTATTYQKLAVVELRHRGLAGSDGPCGGAGLSRAPPASQSDFSADRQRFGMPASRSDSRRRIGPTSSHHANSPVSNRKTVWHRGHLRSPQTIHPRRQTLTPFVASFNSSSKRVSIDDELKEATNQARRLTARRHSPSQGTMQTHLSLTGKPFGIVATFGRRKLSIRGSTP